jgi:isocitrate/isopropylmalate dehydrogenase
MTIRSAALMLEFMGYVEPAARIYDAVDDAIRAGKVTMSGAEPCTGSPGGRTVESQLVA